MVKRNELYKHYKGHTYKIYAISKKSMDFHLESCVLYYEIYDNDSPNYELIHLPHVIVNTETLKRSQLVCTNIFDVLDNLSIIDTPDTYKKDRITQLEIKYARDNHSHLLWARPYENFIETVKVDGNTIPRFELIKNVQSNDY